MDIFIVSINGMPDTTAFTTLKPLCKHHGLSYATASKGKRIFVKGNNVIRITTAQLIKIAGRVANFKGKQNRFTSGQKTE